VAASSGEDSLSLLRLLQVRRRSAQEQYDLVVLHMLDGALHDEGNSLERLETWLQQAGLEHHLLDAAAGCGAGPAPG